MATVATRKTRAGDLIKMEAGLGHGYERKSRSITVPADAEIGMVFKGDGTLIAAVDVEAAGSIAGEEVSILVDDAIYTDGLGAGTRAYAVLSGGVGSSGAAIVVREQLKFADAMSAANIDEVIIELNAAGIKVVTQN